MDGVIDRRPPLDCWRWGDGRVGQFHVWQNALAYVPMSDQRSDVARAIRNAFLPTGQQRIKEILALYALSAPMLAAWLEENLPQGFAVFALPPAHHGRLRISMRSNESTKELKRRTGVARVFPTELSLLRLIPAHFTEKNLRGLGRVGTRVARVVGL